MRVQFPAKFLAEFGWDNYHPDGEPENEAEEAFWPALRAGTQKRQGKGYTYIMEATPEVLGWMAADARSWASTRLWDVDADVARVAREALELAKAWEGQLYTPKGQVAELVGKRVVARVAWPGERPYHAQVAGTLDKDAAGTYILGEGYNHVCFAPEDVVEVVTGEHGGMPVITLRPAGGAQ